PPRAWRAPRSCCTVHIGSRTTSTCVESTSGTRRSVRARTDHLHVRGEHSSSRCRRRSATGPPPRAWRAHSGALVALLYVRTTSTCVESASHELRPRRARPDHLHVRGEHVARRSLDPAAVGPPPRAWRALTLLPWDEGQERTTSTCVESTLSGASAPPPTA